MTKEDEKTVSANIPKELNDRIEKFLSSSFSTVKNKKSLFALSITQFLDKEEKVVEEIKKIRGYIEKGK